MFVLIATANETAETAGIVFSSHRTREAANRAYEALAKKWSQDPFMEDLFRSKEVEVREIRGRAKKGEHIPRTSVV